MRRQHPTKVAWLHPTLMDYRLPMFRHMQKGFDITLFLCNGSGYDPEFQTILSTSNSNRRPSLADLAKLYRLIRGADVVVASFLWNGFTFAAILLSKLLRKPIVVWEEQSHLYSSVWERFKRLYCRWVEGFVDEFFVLGLPQEKYLDFIGVAQSRIFRANEYPGVIYESVQASGFSVPGAGVKHIVLFLGRLIPVKGVEYLILAMRKVRAKFPDACLIVAGDGPLREKLQDLVSSEERAFVHFLGRVDSWEDKAALFQASKVVCVPSVTMSDGEVEGGPLVVLEALSAGRPVIASKSTGSSAAFIQDGVNGYLVPERDADALGDRILEVLGDSDHFSNGARESFANVPDHAHQVRVLTSAIEAALCK